MAIELTKKQKQIYDYIIRRVSEGDAYPTLREIGSQFDISVGTAQDQFAALEAKGLVKRQSRGLARGFSLTAAAIPGIRIPILGRVGAGGGIIAQEDIEGHLTFKNFTRGTDFLLRVKGDSMAGIGIMDGDHVQVRKQATADDGDIVVALVGEEGVVKRLKRRGRSLQLESANSKYPPITSDFQIIGKVLGSWRRYGK